MRAVISTPVGRRDCSGRMLARELGIGKASALLPGRGGRSEDTHVVTRQGLRPLERTRRLHAWGNTVAALFLVFLWIWRDACDPVKQAMFL